MENNTTEKSYVGKSKSAFDIEFIVVSSNVKKDAPIKYSTSTGTLQITYHKGDVYNYYNVEPKIVDGLKEAESAGTYLRQNIFNNYECENLGKVGTSDA